VTENITIRFRAAGQRATNRVVRGVESRFRRMGRRISARLQRVRAAVFSVRGALAAMAGAAVLGRITKKLVDAFAVQQQAVIRLRGALRDAGAAGERALTVLTDNAARLQRATTAADESIIAATASLSRMVPSLDVEGLRKAQQIMVALGDEFFGGDTERAAQILGKTLRSTTNALVRYGIEIDTSVSAQEKINQLFEQTNNLFRGAEDRADTLTGRITQMKNAWGDLQEALGGVIAQTLGFQSEAEGATDRVAEWTAAVNENRERIGAWINVVIQSVRFAGQALKTLIRVAFNVGQAVGNVLQIIVSEAIGQILQLANRAVGALNQLVEGANKLPGVDIDFRFAGFDADRFLGFAQDEFQRLLGNIGDGIDSVSNLAEAWERVFRASERAATAQRGAVGVAGGDADGGGRRAGADAFALGGQTGARLIDTLSNATEVIADKTIPTLEELADEAGRGFETIANVAITSMGQAVAAAAQGFADIAQIVIQTITQILQALSQRGGFLGGVFGGLGVPVFGAIGGIIGAIAGGGGGRPQPVTVENRDPLPVEEQRQRGPDNVTLIVQSSTTGEILDEIQFQLGRRERRDVVRRIPAGTRLGIAGA